MENEVKMSDDTQRIAAMEDNETQRLNLSERDILAERDTGIAQGLDKVVTALDLLRLEMQGIRMVLEALVAKS